MVIDIFLFIQSKPNYNELLSFNCISFEDEYILNINYKLFLYTNSF